MRSNKYGYRAKSLRQFMRDLLDSAVKLDLEMKAGINDQTRRCSKCGSAVTDIWKTTPRWYLQQKSGSHGAYYECHRCHNRKMAQFKAYEKLFNSRKSYIPNSGDNK